jgi:hypothetical protein
VTPSKFTRSSGPTRKAHKIGIYGPGGVGKSSLEALCPGIVIADVEQSTADLNVERVNGITVIKPDGTIDGAASWQNLRAWVQSVNTPDYRAIGVDSMTRAEDWCAAFVIATKKANDGAKATDSIEDFKYKAGLQFVHDEFKRFLSDLEACYLRGVNIVMIAHNDVTKFQNPDGSNYLREQPRLIHVDGKASNMAAWVEFLDHLVYIGLDTVVDKGKAKGGGSRTLYTAGTPARLAKSRTLNGDPIVYEPGSTELWDSVFGK